MWAPGHRIHWSYCIPDHLEVAGLIERLSDLVKFQLWCQLGDNIQDG